MIRTEHLTKSYGGLVAVNDLNLDIPQGQFFAFLGPNGAGKTTTIKLLTGLLAWQYLCRSNPSPARAEKIRAAD